MPVVVAIGAAVGASAMGATIAAGVAGLGVSTAIAGVVGSAIGGAIGGAIAGGVASSATGGDFIDGFKAGAVGGLISGGLGAVASNLTEAATASNFPGVTLPTETITPTAGFDVADLGSGLNASTASGGITAPTIAPTLGETLGANAIATQAPTSSLSSLYTSPELSLGAQAGVAPGTAALGQTGSTVSSNTLGSQLGKVGSSGQLGNIFGEIKPAQAGMSLYDTMMRTNAINKATDAAKETAAKSNVQYGQLSSLGTNIINQRMTQAQQTKAKMDAVLAKWGAR